MPLVFLELVSTEMTQCWKAREAYLFVGLIGRGVGVLAFDSVIYVYS